MIDIEEVKKKIDLHLVYKDIRGITDTLNDCEEALEQQQSRIEELKKDSELDTDNLIKHLTNELYYGDYEEYDDGEKTCYKYIDKNEINGRIKEAFKSLPKPPKGEV